MTSTAITGTTSFDAVGPLERLAMRGGLALVAWSLHHDRRHPSAHVADCETRRQAAEHRRNLLLPRL